MQFPKPTERTIENAPQKSSRARCSYFQALAIAACVLFSIFSRLISWGAVFNVASPAARLELPSTVAALFGCFVVGLPLGVVQRVQIGYQEGYRNNLWEMWGNLLGLGGLLIAMFCKAGLPWLVLSITGAKPFALCCNFINQFYPVRPWLRPRWALVRWPTCLHLMHAGIAFCGVTAATLLGIGTDNLVIAHICGSSAVAKYDVVNKVSSLTLFIGYFAAPLWPAFSEAQTRNDAIWLRSAFRHTTILAASIAAAICLSLLLVGRNIVRLWVGPALVPSFSFLAGFCCYRFLAGASEAAVPLLNTAPLLKTHLLIASVSAIVAVCSKIIAAKYAGIEGVIWATAASYALLFYAPAIIIADRWSSQLERRCSRQTSIGTC